MKNVWWFSKIKEGEAASSRHKLNERSSTRKREFRREEKYRGFSERNFEKQEF